MKRTSKQVRETVKPRVVLEQWARDFIDYAGIRDLLARLAARGANMVGIADLLLLAYCNQEKRIKARAFLNSKAQSLSDVQNHLQEAVKLWRSASFDKEDPVDVVGMLQQVDRHIEANCQYLLEMRPTVQWVDLCIVCLEKELAGRTRRVNEDIATLLVAAGIGSWNGEDVKRRRNRLNHNSAALNALEEFSKRYRAESAQFASRLSERSLN